MNNHQTVIVRKPWGYEYLAYKNNDVALWVLHINENERTSLHCHANKSTGLVVLNGTAMINFIADHSVLEAPAKKMIRRGLFHQTHALTDVVMFEIETPVDKNDLVRLRDNYGRKNAGYEKSDHELPKREDCLWIDDTANKYNFVGRTLTIEPATDINILSTKKPTDIIMFLQGGLIKSIDGRTHHVLQPGDVGVVKVVNQVAQEMDGFAPGTVIMTIE